MGGKQPGFSDYELITVKKQTKREKFLAEIEVVAPWQALIDLIEPHYPGPIRSLRKNPAVSAKMVASLREV
jgi:IS5 family transposase